jgi:curved DNA-binding protein CbpA
MPCIRRLQTQTFTTHEIALASPELDAHKLLAILYALVACDCLTLIDAPGRITGPLPAISGAADPARARARPPTPAPGPSSTPSGGDQARRAALQRSLAQGTVRGVGPIPTPTKAEGSTRIAHGANHPGAAKPGSPPQSRSTGPHPAIPAGNRSGSTPPTSPPSPPRARSPSNPAGPTRDPTRSGAQRTVDADTRSRSRPVVTRDQLRQSAKGRRATHAIKIPAGFKSGSAISAISAEEVRSLVMGKLRDLDRGVDHFALLGLPVDAHDHDVHEAYFQLAKRLHPDRLRAVGAMDLEADAQRLFARINEAFATLSNPRKLAEYRQLLQQGGEEMVRQRQADAEQLAARIFEAEEHFRQGEMALRRNAWASAAEQFQLALTLNPEEGEHHAALAWALWCSTTDKAAINDRINDLLLDAGKKSPNSAAVWMYRGSIAKLRGDTKTARTAFKRVLELDENNAAAQTELRLLKDEEDKPGRKKK